MNHSKSEKHLLSDNKEIDIDKNANLMTIFPTPHRIPSKGR